MRLISSGVRCPEIWQANASKSLRICNAHSVGLPLFQIRALSIEGPDVITRRQYLSLALAAIQSMLGSPRICLTGLFE